MSSQPNTLYEGEAAAVYAGFLSDQAIRGIVHDSLSQILAIVGLAVIGGACLFLLTAISLIYWLV